MIEKSYDELKKAPAPRRIEGAEVGRDESRGEAPRRSRNAWGRGRGGRGERRPRRPRGDRPGEMREPQAYGEGRDTQEHREPRGSRGPRRGAGEHGETREYGERKDYGGERREYGGERREYGGERREYGGERREYGGERRGGRRGRDSRRGPRGGRDARRGERGERGGRGGRGDRGGAPREPGMEKYQLVRTREETKKQDNEIFVSIGANPIFAIKDGLMQFKKHRVQEIVIRGSGQALPKAVRVAEEIKRREPGLHQQNSFEKRVIKDLYKATEEGLNDVTRERTIEGLEIVLSKAPKDTRHSGYQAPIAVSLVENLTVEQVEKL